MPRKKQENSNIAVLDAELSPVARLNRDLKNASKLLTHAQARYLVDAYYMMQDDRKRSNNQIRALEENSEPSDVIEWFGLTATKIEDDLRSVLGIWARTFKAGRWAQSINGIGNVISAGLLAFIDIAKAPTAGCIWSLAGIESTSRWQSREKVAAELASWPNILTNDHFEVIFKEWGRSPASMARALCGLPNYSPSAARELIKNANIKKKDVIAYLAKRPYNAALKTIAYHIGECIVRASSSPKDIYGKVYYARKKLEIERNEQGLFAGQAKKELENKDYGRDTDAYCWYAGCLTPEKAAAIRNNPKPAAGDALKMAGEPGSGMAMLPPAHIHARARRYTAKLFLAHFHEALWREKHGGIESMPKPYIFTDQAKKAGLGEHTNWIHMPDPEGVFAG